MNRFTLCSSLLLAGALLTSATPQGDVIPADPIFPLPSKDLVIDIGGDATPSLADVLKSFEEISAHNLHISAETRSLLKNVSTGLSRSVTIPKTEVYSYVEALLADSGFLVAEIRRAQPRILSVYSLQTAERQNARGRARAVPIDDVHLYERHPAILIQSVVAVKYLDARQLSNSLRSMMNDPNVEFTTPLSEGNILLCGTAPRVADWIRLIRTADANAMPEEVPEEVPEPPDKSDG
jgi:hypothetical protein